MQTTHKQSMDHELKAKLKEAYLVSQTGSNLMTVSTLLAKINSMADLSNSFLIRPKGHCTLPIMGRVANGKQLSVHVRGVMEYPSHSFCGKRFNVTTKGELVLSASDKPSAPWCVLSFNGETGEPNFYLGVLAKGESNQNYGAL